MEIDIESIGTVVGFEGDDGGMLLQTWVGETVSLWAVFDESKRIEGFPEAFDSTSGNILSAYSIDMPRPLNARRIICFKK